MATQRTLLVALSSHTALIFAGLLPSTSVTLESLLGWVGRLSVEPPAGSQAEQEHFDHLRALASENGWPWPVLRSADLQDLPVATPTTQVETDQGSLFELSFAIMVPDFQPGAACCANSLPLGVEDLVELIQAQRDPTCAARFPTLAACNSPAPACLGIVYCKPGVESTRRRCHFRHARN